MTPLYPESAAADSAQYQTTLGVFDIYRQTIIGGQHFVNISWGNEYEDWSYFPYNLDRDWHPDIDDAPQEGLKEALEFAETLYKLMS